MAVHNNKTENTSTIYVLGGATVANFPSATAPAGQDLLTYFGNFTPTIEVITIPNAPEPGPGPGPSPSPTPSCKATDCGTDSTNQLWLPNWKTGATAPTCSGGCAKNTTQCCQLASPPPCPGSCQTGSRTASETCTDSTCSNCCTQPQCPTTCPAGQQYDPKTCACTPQCKNKQCGPDGCGAFCGTCSSSQTCNTTTWTCTDNNTDCLGFWSKVGSTTPLTGANLTSPSAQVDFPSACKLAYPTPSCNSGGKLYWNIKTGQGGGGGACTPSAKGPSSKTCPAIKPCSDGQQCQADGTCAASLCCWQAVGHPICSGLSWNEPMDEGSPIGLNDNGFNPSTGVTPSGMCEKKANAGLELTRLNCDNNANSFGGATPSAGGPYADLVTNPGKVSTCKPITQAQLKVWNGLPADDPSIQPMPRIGAACMGGTGTTIDTSTRGIVGPCNWTTSSGTANMPGDIKEQQINEEEFAIGLKSNMTDPAGQFSLISGLHWASELAKDAKQTWTGYNKPNAQSAAAKLLASGEWLAAQTNRKCWLPACPAGCNFRAAQCPGPGPGPGPGPSPPARRGARALPRFAVLRRQQPGSRLCRKHRRQRHAAAAVALAVCRYLRWQPVWRQSVRKRRLRVFFNLGNVRLPPEPAG